MDISKLLKQLPSDKIRMNNWNKNPIKMGDMLKFLTVDLIRSEDNLGINRGWSELSNKEHALFLNGGFVNGVEYLDYIKYGKNLDNGYNNYVNPFYLDDLLTIEGKHFFLNYYKPEIDMLVGKLNTQITRLKSDIEEKNKELNTIEWFKNNFVNGE